MLHAATSTAGQANSSGTKHLLNRKFSRRPAPMRPPWSIDETQFDDVCTGCADCISACPNQLLSLGRGRLPVINFSNNECTFCGRCAEACQAGAIDKSEPLPWNIVAQIDSSCLSIQRVSCRSCGDICASEAIHFQLEVGGRATPILQVPLCTGCGACVAPCPVDAISMIAAHQAPN